jgi:hypothetical protein
MDLHERELFQKSVRQVAAAHTGSALDAALVDVGWVDAMALDPRTAVAVLFEAQGAERSTSSALDLVVAGALGLDPAIGLVLPALGRWVPPGDTSGARLVVGGIGLATLAGRPAVAIATTGGGLATVAPSTLSQRTIRGLDPTFGLVEVGGTVQDAEVRPITPAAWDDAVAAGQRAVAHELLGGMRAMLGLAREHALERIQFGRPIAGFQAVRHRLAECLVAIEGADAALGGAWEDGSALSAGVAKAVAGHAARTVARHCQQVLAGIGFTAEHPFHGYLRRTIALDQVLGDARSLTLDLGERLLEARELPAVLPL